MATLKNRHLKASCPECGYTVRITRRWLDEVGPPFCPSPSCYEATRTLQTDYLGEHNDADRAADAIAEWSAEITRDTRVVRDVWRHARKPHDCHGCGSIVAPREEYLERTLSDAGALETVRLCAGCGGGAAFPSEAARTDHHATRADAWRKGIRTRE